MTPRQQIKNLSVTSDPITARFRQETDTLPDNNCIADAYTHYHVFLDCIQSRRKLVWGLGDNRQEWSMEVEQDHIVMSKGIEDREVMAVMAAWWYHRKEI